MNLNDITNDPLGSLISLVLEFHKNPSRHTADAVKARVDLLVDKVETEAVKKIVWEQHKPNSNTPLRWTAKIGNTYIAEIAYNNLEQLQWVLVSQYDLKVYRFANLDEAQAFVQRQAGKKAVKDRKF
jgi:hypothetical protein